MTPPPRHDLPLELVHAALRAVADDELEEAFARLLTQLRPWGIVRGALLAGHRGPQRIAGDDVDTTRARRLVLHDGLDTIGELLLEVEEAPPEELLELLRDFFGLALGRTMRTLELATARAAASVNEAGTIDEALEILAETCRRIVDVPNATVAVWEPDLSSAIVRAAAGDALAVVGDTIVPGANVAYRAVSSGEVVYMERDRAEGLGPRLQQLVERSAAGVAVPMLAGGIPRITFQVAWRDVPSPARLERTVRAIQTLDRLTSVAYRAEQERARRADDELLRTVVDNVPAGIWVSHGGRDLLNAAGRRLVGLEPDAPLPRAEDFGFRRLDGTPLDLDEFPARACRRRGVASEARLLVEVHGRDRVLDLKAVPFRGGCVETIRDVTEEHEEQLLTRRFLEQLFEALPLAAVVADAETGEILDANPAFARLVGFAPEEVEGVRPPYPWWQDPDAPFVVEGPAFERMLRRPDGRSLPVEVLPFLVHGTGGTAQRAVAIVSDLSERRHLERQLLQSGKLAAIGELAAGVAHEINNPLFAILGLVEFLIRETEPGTRAHERLLLVQQTGLEIKEIVKALLEFARERVDEHRPLDVREVVESTVALVRRTTSARNVELVERYTDEPTSVLGSPNQIKQVVLNLITNAQQAMPGGGTIEIGVESGADEVVVTVADDGPGIPPELLGRVFEPFFTTKRDLGGTGLGLAVSHGIAEMHEGELTVESRPDGGTRFRLSLPRLAGPVAG